MIRNRDKIFFIYNFNHVLSSPVIFCHVMSWELLVSDQTMFGVKSANFANLSSNWTMLKFLFFISFFSLFFHFAFWENWYFVLFFQGENEIIKSVFLIVITFSAFHKSYPSPLPPPPPPSSFSPFVDFPQSYPPSAPRSYSAFFLDYLYTPNRVNSFEK